MFRNAQARANANRARSDAGYRPRSDIKVDDYNLPKEWGSLHGVPAGHRATIEAKLHKLHKMKHLGATEGERAAGAAALARLKAIHKLQAVLDNVIEFGQLSISTAKNVIRDLNIRGGGNPAKLFRPKTGAANYVYPGMTASERLEAQEKLGMKKLPLERSVVVPRKAKGVRDKLPYNALSFRLHETGHSADPHLPKWVAWKRKAVPAMQKYAAEGKAAEAERRGTGIIRSVLQQERRANQQVLTSVKTHGTPEEVGIWKKFANTQMKEGYRRPLFRIISEGGGVNTLTGHKQLMKQVPELRGKTLNLSSLWSNSSRNVIHFSDLDSGISYNSAPPAIQKLLDKVKARKKKAGETDTNQLSSRLDDMIQFREYPKTVLQSSWRKWKKGSAVTKGVKSVGTSPLGLAARKNQNQLLTYRSLTPHIEDIAHGLSKFRFISGQLDDLIQLGSDPRPRNNLGEFSGQEEGGPDPNAMVKTYRVAPAQTGMQPNADPQANQEADQPQGVFGKIAAALKNFRKQPTA